MDSSVTEIVCKLYRAVVPLTVRRFVRIGVLERIRNHIDVERAIRAGLREPFENLKREVTISLRHCESMEKAQKLLGRSPAVKLELGGGQDVREGWINVDWDAGESGLALDLRRSLPFPDNSVTAICASHVLEHFSYPEPLGGLLRECHRVLKPGGLFSASVPDAGRAFRIYAMEEKEFLRQRFWSRPENSWRTTPMDDLNMLVYWKGLHEFMFDEQNLVATLVKAGFSDVRLRNFDEAVDSILRKHQSLYVQGAKGFTESPRLHVPDEKSRVSNFIAIQTQERNWSSPGETTSRSQQSGNVMGTSMIHKCMTKALNFFRNHRSDKADDQGSHQLSEVPLVFENAYGIRFIHYPWTGQTIDDQIQRRCNAAEFEAYRRILRPGNLCLDIGAHVGLHAAYISRLVGPEGRVHCFEPTPETYWRLRETLALNRCENVTAHNRAISSAPGRAHLNVFDSKFSSWNTMGCPVMEANGVFHKPSESIEVECETIDGFCAREGITHVDFAKIDVEGHEKHVLTGARRMLSEGAIAVLSFEVSKPMLEGSATEAREVFDILRDVGYKCYRYDLGSGAFAGPVTDSAEFHENYFASRGDLTARQDGATKNGGPREVF